MMHDNEKERQDLKRERGKAMTDGLMKYWKQTPRSMAEIYASRCLAADPLTERYFELVGKLRALEARNEVAAENWKAGGICRRRPI